MTQSEARAILDHLEIVWTLRHSASADATVADRLRLVKAFQHRRFEWTYRDLSAQPAYAGAVRFFLNELYGPQDFTLRDAQFARIVPALVRLFPVDVVSTMQSLSELHALSEQLDHQMAGVLAISTQLQAPEYVIAWQAVGQRPQRLRQVELMHSIGLELVRFTKSAVLRRSLKLMRRPADLAGLATLQRFLERGFDTFGTLRDPEHFLNVIASRETALINLLFGNAAGIDWPKDLSV